MTPPTPAMEALAATFGDESLWAQVLVKRAERGFDLRHEADCNQPASRLATVRVDELRVLSQNTAAGQFRPLKSAPNLAAGWQAHAASLTELETALNAL
jgi:hypothetical protein